MSNLIREISIKANVLAEAMGLEPDVRADFTDADPVTIAAAIAVLIGKGVSTAEKLHRYLARRGCPYDEKVIAFILRVYDGRDRRVSLWQRGENDRYQRTH